MAGRDRWIGVWQGRTGGKGCGRVGQVGRGVAGRDS